jgi:hypothetical protein
MIASRFNQIQIITTYFQFNLLKPNGNYTYRLF